MKFEEFFPGLSCQSFGLMVVHSLNRRQLTGFCSRLGLDIPGYRLEKIPIPELVGYLFEDCHNISAILPELEKLLDKANRKIVGSIRSCTASEVKKELRDWEELIKKNELGCFLWAAFRDSRATVNRQADTIRREFDRMVEELAASFEEELESEPPPPLPDTPLPGDETEADEYLRGEGDEDGRELMAGIYRLKKLWDSELKVLEKHLKKASAEAKKARSQAEKRREDLRDRDERITALRKELKEWKQCCAALEERAAAKKAAPDDTLLRSRLNSLERDLRKKEYEHRRNEKKLVKLAELEIEVKKGQASLHQALGEMKLARERERKLREEAANLRGTIRAMKDARKPGPPKPPPPPAQERLGIFLDSRNIYHTVRDTYSGARINFDELFTRIARGRKVVRAIAYVVQADFTNKEGFFDMLKFKGFQVKRRPLKVRADRSMKGDWDMGMALDLIKYADDLDTIALVSGDGDFYDLLIYLKKKDVKLEVYGVETSTALDLKRTADLYVPIDRNWLLQ